MGFVEVRDCTFYIEDKGEGPPILLIPPSGSTASTWGTVPDELAAAARVITFDRRGYTRTGGPTVHSAAVHTAGVHDPAYARAMGTLPEAAIALFRTPPDRFIAEYAERLGLNQETLATIRTIVEASRAQGETLRAELRQAYAQMRASLSQEMPKEAAVMQQADAIGALELAIRKQRLQAMLRIRALLTPAQRQELSRRPPTSAGTWTPQLQRPQRRIHPTRGRPAVEWAPSIPAPRSRASRCRRGASSARRPSRSPATTRRD